MEELRFDANLVLVGLESLRFGDDWPVSMVMGLMPVVGVTLPFVSYGGSSIITMMMGIGILHTSDRHPKTT